MKERTVFILFIIFVLLEGIVLSQGVHASVSFKRAIRVFSKVQNVSGYHVMLNYSEKTVSNAYCSYDGITITQGMLNDLETDAELASVLGHEMGHFASKDVLHKSSEFTELRADKLGHNWCTKLYSTNKCLRFLYNMRVKYGEEGGDGVHPTWTVRINNLKNL